ncbi:MAG: response regulator [candidate division Zixibacteria bacterium]|nr:response regulator [candidate division Zixibacteria bacterium]
MARILVIDDSQVIRDLLADFLADSGHFVDCVEDSEEGIRMALAGSYDICICDLHIPKKNGFQIYQAISATKPKLTFIMTDSLPDSLADQISEAGVPYILRKPFDLDQLREVLATVCASIKTI